MFRAGLWENPMSGILGGGGWKRVLRWSCEPTRNRKGGTGQASTYGSARQCPTRPTRVQNVSTVAYALTHDDADWLVMAAMEINSVMNAIPGLYEISASGISEFT